MHFLLSIVHATLAVGLSVSKVLIFSSKSVEKDSEFLNRSLSWKIGPSSMSIFLWACEFRDGLSVCVDRRQHDFGISFFWFGLASCVQIDGGTQNTKPVLFYHRRIRGPVVLAHSNVFRNLEFRQSIWQSVNPLFSFLGISWKFVYCTPTLFIKVSPATIYGAFSTHFYLSLRLSHFTVDFS